MMSDTLYDNEEEHIVVRFRPYSKSVFRPYVRIECYDDSADFMSIDELDKFIGILQITRGLLKKELEKTSLEK